VYRW